MALRIPRWLAVLGAAGVAVAASPGEAAPQVVCDRPCVGPPHGAVLAAGGGRLGNEIYEEFVRLAGGEEARIVLIPTAGDQHGSYDGWTAAEELRAAGVHRVEILHTRSRAVADLEVFAAPLREATGVWISGGHQNRLMEVYLDTRTHRELVALLRRGGVIGGNSAGASALASYLLRGTGDNTVVADSEHDVGFGFLRGVAIDQHLLARARENDLLGVLDAHPNLLGIGLNEGSAVLITGDLTRVIGKSVAIYDVTDPLMLIPLRWLRPGDVYDLGTRRLIRTDAEEPPMPPPFR